MTIRFTDGFDSYAATADFLKKWQSNGGTGTWSSSAGRNGGGALQFSSNGIEIRTFPLSNVGNVANFAFWFKSTAKPSPTQTIFNCLNLAGTAMNAVQCTTNGFIQLLKSDATILATGSLNICDGNWHWVEILGTWNGSSNSQCVIDGVSQWNLTVNTSALTFSGVGFTGFNSATVTFDDITIYDNTGSSPINSDFPLGPQQISTLRPNGDSAIQFSPDTGSTNYTQINEVNGDTTHYVQDGTSGDQDLYDYDDLSFSPSKIWGVMANAYANNPGIGSINHNQLCKNNVTTTTGTTTQTPVTNARVVQEPFVLNPNTGSAWASAGALNTALFGIKVT